VSRPAVPTPRGAWQHAALVAAAVTLVLVTGLEGPWRAALEIPVFVLGLGAVHAALTQHRTTGAIVWRGLGAALVAFAASSAAETLQLFGFVPGITGTIETALDIAAYGALVAAALCQLALGGRGRDREAWIDTASLLLAAGLTVLAFSGGVDSLGTGFTELRIGVSLLTALVLLVCVPLAVPDNGRSVSAMALLAAGVLTILGYGARILAGPLSELGFLDELPLFAVPALVLAGRHPSVATLGRRAHAENSVSTSRVVGLGAALLVSPALLILWGLRDGGLGYVLGLGSMLLTVLALWRLATINTSREQTRAALVASEARLQLLLDNAADVIAIVDASGTVAYMSPAVQSLLGRPPAEYLGRNAIELADPRDQPRLRSAVAAAGEAGGMGAGFVDTDIRVQHSSGGTRWVEMRISGMLDAAGIEGWVVNFREVTDRKLFEDELRRQATTDPLTGLMNRTAFSDRLAAATGTIDPTAPPAVLFVDVDDFKSVNDTLGHATGDQLLRTVAARLSADVRAEDVVARLGGDEFAVLLAFADGERLRDVSDRLLVALRTPMEITGTTLTVTASIGGALGAPGDTAERLLHSADTAMYTAKRSGKNSRALLGAAQDAPT
jgi:diguanylate cyclase (GGDEF)-like protein/PAS domain S-box-containing protein